MVKGRSAKKDKGQKQEIQGVMACTKKDRTHKERYKEAKRAAKKAVAEAKDIKDEGG